MVPRVTVFLPPESTARDGHCSVILADSHVRFRRELRKILEEHPNLKVLGEANNRSELFGLLEQGSPAVVILDVAMPDLRVQEGIRLIRLQHPEVKVLLLVMDQEPEYLSQGLATGAAGVLPKQYVAGLIFPAIAAVCRGEVYIPPPSESDYPPQVQTLAREEANVPDR